MKEKIIEAAGKTWRALGEKGQSTPSELAKILREKEDVINQAIGWLAREDKINYATQQNKTIISLIEPELQAFRRIAEQNLQNTKTAGRKRGA